MTTAETTYTRAGGEEFKAAERAMRTSLTPGLPAIVRLDGRAFHSYCRGLARPYDQQFMDDMDQVAIALAQEVDGVRVAYVQSDEISLLLTDRSPGAEERSGFMFGGQVQKLASISSALASTVLNQRRYGVHTDTFGLFDARVFSLPDLDAVRRYFQWRQGDARVNSLSMLAESVFPSKKLIRVSSARRAAMLRDVGADPADLPEAFVHGRVVLRRPVAATTTFTHRGTGVKHTVEYVRREHYSDVAPDFGGFDFAAAG